MAKQTSPRTIDHTSLPVKNKAIDSFILAREKNIPEKADSRNPAGWRGKRQLKEHKFILICTMDPLSTYKKIPGTLENDIVPFMEISTFPVFEMEQKRPCSAVHVYLAHGYSFTGLYHLDQGIKTHVHRIDWCLCFYKSSQPNTMNGFILLHSYDVFSLLNYVAAVLPHVFRRSLLVHLDANTLEPWVVHWNSSVNVLLQQTEEEFDECLFWSQT